ncbi:MAG: 16S rRNA (adenine(1518)-N(6)/adenine(1519)-N(6))-dimethyltransferase, partial [Limosilactobacillus fermentum]
GLIRGCFAHRRKSLWNNLKTIVGKDEDRLGKVKEVLDRLEIDPQTRPERLSLVDFINLANAMHEKELL